MRETVTVVTAAIGGFIANVFGGWSDAMTTLIIFMAIDYLTGLIVAGVFQKSGKSENGALESRAGWKGLCRKGMSLLIVLIAARLDMVMGTAFAKDCVVIGFVVNESISILENAGLMGVKYPTIITRALEVLTKKAEDMAPAQKEMSGNGEKD